MLDIAGMNMDIFGNVNQARILGNTGIHGISGGLQKPDLGLIDIHEEMNQEIHAGLGNK